MGLNEFKPLLVVLKVNNSTHVKMLIAAVFNTYLLLFLKLITFMYVHYVGATIMMCVSTLQLVYWVLYKVCATPVVLIRTTPPLSAEVVSLNMNLGKVPRARNLLICIIIYLETQSMD